MHKKEKHDLHIHSYFSDGTDSPSEIVRKAKELDAAGISITDHDTVAGNKEGRQMARELDIDFVCGVELSTSFDESLIHLLGYFPYSEIDVVDLFCKKNLSRRMDRNRAIFKKLYLMSMKLDEYYLDGYLGRMHIAQLMVEKGYCLTIQECFDKWIGDNKPCYVEGKFVYTLDAIDFLHKVGGKAVLAHPMFLGKSLLRKVIKLPFDGLEYFYGNEMRFRCNLDISHLSRVGGSDYHGYNKKPGKILSAYTDAENYRRLFA